MTVDIFDPAIRADPYPSYRALRDVGPVVQDKARGFWIVTGHEEAATALRSSTALSSTATAVDAVGAFQAPTMLSSDPPDHTRLRHAVARAFTPRVIAQMEQHVAATARRLLDGVDPASGFDVVDRIAYPLPVVVIAEMLGVPAEDAPAFRAWSNDLVGVNELSSPEDFARGREAAEAIRAYLSEAIERRREEPTDDLVGRLVAANDDGAVSSEELLASCVLLLVAGNETTTNLISNAVLALTKHDGLAARLADQRDLIPAAVEEVLRLDPPVQATLRLVVEPVHLGEVDVPVGDIVLLSIGGANRDPRRFPDPDTFDLERDDRAHLGFGHGIHFCLGATLARIEARAALDAILDVAPVPELADRGLTYGPSFFLRGLTELHVRA